MNKLCPTCNEWTLRPASGSFGELDQVYVCESCDQIWSTLGLEAVYTTMKLENKKEIVIEKFRFGSAVPPYVAFCHRHLEKEIPGSVRDQTQKEERFLVPVDLLKLTLPSEIVGEIDSVELIYNFKP